jgi:hypothetical protein
MKNLNYEIWKQFENSDYWISTEGRVKNKSTEYILVQHKTENGRMGIHLSDKIYTIHRLVALVFLPNSKNLPQVDHIDKNFLNIQMIKR